MYNGTISCEEKMSLLKSRKAVCGSEAVFYGFYSLRTVQSREYYALEAATPLESELCVIGNDYAYARAVFERIADGGVTPTSLLDIISDLYMSKKY